MSFRTALHSAILTSFATTIFAVAAPAAAEEKRVALEEVLVTARRIEESSQEVPVAITAITDDLNQSSIRDLRDLNGFAPNVSIDEDGSRSNGAAITIRGISPTRTDDNSFDAPVAVMIDGIYLGSLAGQVLENFDIERVEVLRGPQGTLFGRNVTGGAVLINTKTPTDEFEFNARASYEFPEDGGASTILQGSVSGGLTMA